MCLPLRLFCIIKLFQDFCFLIFFNGSFESRQQNNHPKVVHLDASRVTARGLYDLVSRFWDFQSCQNSTLAKYEGRDKQKKKRIKMTL